MLIDNGLDQWQIGVGNSPVPYGSGQHDHSIPEKVQGRQHKMQGDENIFSGEFLPGNPAGGVGR
jgi:hypothetical protein